MRKAAPSDKAAVWSILQQAIERRRIDGSNQWQDGYPNPDTVEREIALGHGYVLLSGESIAAYAALIVNDEPAYDHIEGKWLTGASDFLVVHRVAVDNHYLGRGIALKLFSLVEAMAVAQGIPSIRVDTNFDNQAMLHILDKLGYSYCGEVLLRESPRKAFEKVLSLPKEMPND